MGFITRAMKSLAWHLNEITDFWDFEMARERIRRRIVKREREFPNETTIRDDYYVDEELGFKRHEGWYIDDSDYIIRDIDELAWLITWKIINDVKGRLNDDNVSRLRKLRHSSFKISEEVYIQSSLKQMREAIEKMSEKELKKPENQPLLTHHRPTSDERNKRKDEIPLFSMN